LIVRNESSISATLYAAGILIKTRSTIANKILARILAFHPLTAQYATADPIRLKLELRFIEKNIRILLGNVLKYVISLAEFDMLLIGIGRRILQANMVQGFSSI
jgi:hypothetical protein